MRRWSNYKLVLGMTWRRRWKDHPEISDTVERVGVIWRIELEDRAVEGNERRDRENAISFAGSVQRFTETKLQQHRWAEDKLQKDDAGFRLSKDEALRVVREEAPTLAAMGHMRLALR